MSYIKVNHLTKKIKGKTILKDISFTCEKGMIYGIIGANGSGKTMLFRALAGLLKLEKGCVEIAGKPVNLTEDYPINVGVILENPDFIEHYTGFENLKYLASMKNLITEQEMITCLKDVGLHDVKNKRVKEYSLGMRQRLGICQAFMENQELLLLDEPTNGLDRMAYELFKSLCFQWKKEGRTLLIATHDKFLVDEIAEVVFEIRDGELT